MLKLGFALEGNSDYPVIPRLSQRLITESFPEINLASPSVLRPRKRGHGFVKDLPTFARQLNDDGVQIIVAVVDTDNTLVGDRRKLLREAEEGCKRNNLPLCLATGLAVRSMEAWLLADETAIFQIFDGDKATVNFPAPENDPNPKNKLNEIVRTLTKGREVTFASYAEELAEMIRLDVLRRKCRYFDDFAQSLLGCAKEWHRINSTGRSTD